MGVTVTGTGNTAAGESRIGRAVCLNWARTDLWEAAEVSLRRRPGGYDPPMRNGSNGGAAADEKRLKR